MSLDPVREGISPENDRLPHDRWVALRSTLRESDLRESDLIQKIADFLRKVLPGAKDPPPKPKEPKFEAVDLGTPTPKSTKYSVAIPSTSSAKSQAPVETSGE
jgi:hypothetical protein